MIGRRLQSGLFLRERLPNGSPRGYVLFVHGATVGSVLFDLPSPGLSVLDSCAARGWAAYAIDLRGYGRSLRASAMDRSPQECELQCNGRQALEDIHEAVQFILAQHAQRTLVLGGGSWGSLTAVRYAIAHPTTVERLLLLAPLYGTRNEGWLHTLADPKQTDRINPALGGYRYATAEDLLARWDPEIADGDSSGVRDPAVFEALVRAELEADAACPKPGAFRVPNGTLHELFEVFSGRPVYDPADIRCPTVLIRGARDLTSTKADMVKLQNKLTHVPLSVVTIPDAGHFMQAERAAPRLHQCLLNALRDCELSLGTNNR
jgi:pimeloyl-ACP methyl ester carboxylesterase